jgi:sulfur carrier protein ThiS adenylyltransferase
MNNFSFEKITKKYFSKQQYKKISSTVIGIAGAGGLGSNCAIFLVRCGFKNFVIADFDIVEDVNLNRQCYFIENIGKPKVECLKEIMLKINPECSIRIHKILIDENNAKEIFKDCNVIIEAFDKPECKAMIVNTFLNSDKLIVSASGLAGFGNSNRIITKKVRENFYLIGDGVSTVEKDKNPPLAPCVNIAAAKEADAVLEWILSSDKRQSKKPKNNKQA